MPSLNETAVPKYRNSTPINILRNADVCQMLKISPTTLWRWERNGSFPSSIELGPNSVGWIESEVLAWIAEKMQNRRGI